MLELVVQEHDASFKKLIPEIIEFVLQQISAILRKVFVHKFIHHTLLHMYI